MGPASGRARSRALRFAAQARGTGGGFMTVRRGTNEFTVRTLEALRGEPRRRARLSSRPHAPLALAQFKSRPAA